MHTPWVLHISITYEYSYIPLRYYHKHTQWWDTPDGCASVSLNTRDNSHKAIYRHINRKCAYNQRRRGAVIYVGSQRGLLNCALIGQV